MKYNKRAVETTPSIKITHFDDPQIAGNLYGVKIGISTPYFGGRRYWFICDGCNRNMGALYQTAEYKPLRCRICNQLSYSSQGYSGISRQIVSAMHHSNRQALMFSNMRRISLTYKGRLTKRLTSYLKHKKLVESLCQLEDTG